MNYFATMPRYAPTLTAISARTIRLLRYKWFLGTGLIILGLTTLILLTMSSKTWWGPGVVTAALAAILYRWSWMSKFMRDMGIADFVITDPKDLAWLAWARDFEPEIDAMLGTKQPGDYRSGDFLEAAVIYARDRMDVPKRAPFHGDGEAAYEALEARREKARRARRDARSDQGPRTGT